MFGIVKTYFSPIRVPEDIEEDRMSQVLSIFWVNIWILVGVNFIGILLVFSKKLGASILMMFFVLILIAVRHFHRRGHIRFASFLLVSGLWATYMTVIAFTGTIRTSIIAIPIVIVAMIVPLLGLRAGFIGAILTLLTTLGVTFLEVTGNTLPAYFPAEPIQNWFHLITAFTILIVPLGQIWKDISVALTRAHKSEHKYRLIFEEANDTIFIMKDDIFVDCNSKATEMFGYTKEEIIGRKPQDFSPIIQPNGQTSENMLHKNIETAIQSGESRYFEWTHIHKDKSEFDAEVSLNLLELENEKYIQAIVRDITERKLAEKKLAEAYDTTLEGWAKALELRDKETEGHSRRVTETTVAVARTMGISEEVVEHIRRGALLHDIGKMGIPDDILRKEGLLTHEERAIVRKHPETAYDLLKEISFLKNALDIPYCHHEKWDGTGYPRELKGEEIPLAARIFAIVDVWDALSSDRPYREAWPKEKIKHYITNEAGKHFDPKVVGVFLQMVEKGKI